MPRRKSYEQWEREQIARDPKWERDLEAWRKTTGSKRKIGLLLDESLEEEAVSAISALRYFRVSRPKRGADDAKVWDEAKKSHSIIVTGDRSDFWSDRKFPLHQCPGVIILVGKSAFEKLRAFVQALEEWDVIGVGRRSRRKASFSHIKVRATPTGTLGKAWDGSATVDIRR
jgi:predicted nuclease of predicted toxin-antitoxin system